MPAPTYRSFSSRAGVKASSLAHVSEQLLERGLIARCPDDATAYELTPDGHATLERLTRTGEQRLTDLLEEWRPEEHPDLAALIVSLAGEFLIDTSALRGQAAPQTVAAGA